MTPELQVITPEPMDSSDGEEVRDITEIDIDDLLNLEVTTASKGSERLQDAPGSLTVITRQQIEDMNAQTLRDVLNVYIPGMDVVPAYFAFGDRINEGIYSRGIVTDPQVLVLWNGVTKFNESTWSTPFTAVEWTLNNVERIEVSRSPIPIYGGQAITIINIITREQDAQGAHVSVDVSFNENDIDDGEQGRKVSAVFGDNIGKWRIGGSLQFYDDIGQAHRDRMGQGGYAYPSSTLRDGTKYAVNTTLSMRSPDDKVVVQTWYKDIDRDNFLSGQSPSPSIDLYSYAARSWLTHAIVRPDKNLQLTVGLMLTEWSNYFNFAGTPFGVDEANYDLFAEGTYTHRFKAAGSHKLLTGLKLEREGQFKAHTYSFDGLNWIPSSADVYAPNASRSIVAPYAEDNWKINQKLSVLGGARLDYYRGFGGKSEVLPTPRVALLASPDKQFTFKAQYATAIRPPSLFERLGATGGPEISAERVHSFEASALFRLPKFRAQLTPFVLLYRNKIEQVISGPMITAENVGETRVYGVDLETFYYFDDRNYVFLNATELKSRDEFADHATYFVASQYINGGVNLNRGHWNVNVNGYLRGKRKLDPSLTINADRAGGIHFMANSSVSYRLHDRLRTYLLVENLTDHDNNVPLAADGLFVPMRARTWHVGVVADL